MSFRSFAKEDSDWLGKDLTEDKVVAAAFSELNEIGPPIPMVLLWPFGRRIGKLLTKTMCQCSMYQQKKRVPEEIKCMTFSVAPNERGSRKA